MAQPATWSRTQIVLHWAVVVLVALQFIFHEGMVEVWDARMSGAIPDVPAPHPHAAIGLVVFFLMLWRLYLRFTRGAPPPPPGENRLFAFAAAAVHVLLYIVLLGMPVSGALAWFGIAPQLAAGHSIAEKILIVLIVIHVLAALVQHFWFRTNVLKRMLGMA